MRALTHIFSLHSFSPFMKNHSCAFMPILQGTERISDKNEKIWGRNLSLSSISGILVHVGSALVVKRLYQISKSSQRSVFERKALSGAKGKDLHVKRG